ncbi:methyltransferase domain-containing protein [Streptomonospora sediminis]
MTDWSPARAELAAALDTAPEIAAAFAAVPREAFIPDRVWPTHLGDPLDRADDPRTWAELIYADQPIVTQVDDGQVGGIGRPSSSSSMPSMMARMLQAADLGQGSRVLEVGTGTGYNAAVLCELVGAGNVTTIEVDPAVAEDARRRLAALGRNPASLVGDGSASVEGGPFDAVIATCSVIGVPPAWITQTRPGGVVVTPWAPAPDLPSGLLARLVVGADGAATGRFAGTSSFMRLRSQRWTGGPPHDLDADPEVRTRADGDPRDVVMEDAGLQLALMTGPWRLGMRWDSPRADPYVWISATTSPSWVRLHGDGRVEQGGPRRLWEELVEARRWWEENGRPAVTGYGLSVDTAGNHRVWFGAPDGPSWRHPGVAG